jgi:uncharacterized protein (TIGR03083 family)
MVDYAAALLEQDRLFTEVVAGADWTAPVPTCPGWTLLQLIRHLGRGHRWAAQIIREQRDSPLDPREVPGGKPPADEAGALNWLNESGRLVVDAVAAVGAQTPVWTFLGPRPAGWWIRRRLHEATVHRADAAIALGAGYELAPELAADGITEWVEIVVAEAGNGRELPMDSGNSLHLHATDVDAKWSIRSDGTALSWNHSHPRATAAARGRAQDLLLAFVRRRDAEEAGVKILGESRVWTSWLERSDY